MGWVQICNDSFSHANTSTGAANSTTGVPTTGGTGSPWTDLTGGVFNIQSNQLNGTTSSTLGYQNIFLERPSGEAHTSSRILITLVANTSMNVQSNLRYQISGQNNYTLSVNFTVSSANVGVYSRISGSFTQIGSSSSFTPTNGHTYSIDFSAVGTSPTTLSVTVTDVTASTVVATYSDTDSTSGLQIAGTYAIGCGSPGGSSQTQIVANVTTYQEDQSFSVSPTTATAGVSEGITATGSNTSWTVGTTFSVSGGSGASISGTSVNASTQVATFTLNPGSSAGSLTISDSTDSATAVVTVSAGASFTVSPTTAITGTNETITATGSGTSWTSGTTFSVSGGTSPSISGTSVNAGAQTATFTLHPGSSAGTLTISDNTDAATANVVVYAPAFTISPSSGTPSTPVTVTATGSHTSWTNTTTFSVSGGTSPSISGVSVNVSAQTATFLLNPGSSIGSLTISDNTDSATAGFTVSVGPFTIPPTSTARIESPGYWVNAAGGRTGGSARQTWRVGSWVKYFWTTSSGSPTATLQMSNATASSEISIAINGVLTDGIGVPASGGINISSYLGGAGSYELQVWFRNSTAASRWSEGNSLVDAGLTVDAGATIGTAPSLRPWGIVIGDSITEGALANAGNSDIMVGYSFLLSQTLDQLGYDCSINACQGQGYLITGDGQPSGDVPAFYLVSGGTYEPNSSSWNKIDANNSLLDSNSQISAYGATSTAPSLVVVNYGTNDAGYSASTSDLTLSVTGVLTALRAAAPSAQLRILLFFGAYTGWSGGISATTAATYATAIRTGVSNYLSANPSDTATKLIDLGSIASTYLMSLTANAEHPGINGHAFAGSAIAGLLGKALTANISAAYNPVNGCSFVRGI